MVILAGLAQLVGCIPELDPVRPDPTTTPEPDAPAPTACIEVLPGVLDLGERRPSSLPVPAGAVVVRSGCDAPLEITELFLSGNETVFALIDPPGLPLELLPGELLTMGVQAEPTEYGTFTDYLTIASNDELRPDTVIGMQIRAVCESADKDVDTDGDGIPDGCDVCGDGDDRIDVDQDGTPDACDRCAGFDDGLDQDGDGVPDDCDICPVGDDGVDNDRDGVPNACDRCWLGDDFVDADADTVPDACDRCAGGDDRFDLDGDSVPDDCDRCAGFHDLIDADLDTVPDGCDTCAGFDDRLDADSDTVPDACDTCDGGDDRLDADLDTVPDGCDACAGFDDALDSDSDTVPNGCDTCEYYDDRLDADGDTVPDGCDRCDGGDDTVDSDGDLVPDDCDRCAGFDDGPDADGDTVPDACDRCPGSDDTADADGDRIPDACDVCPLGDDTIDSDGDLVADACDQCPGGDDAVDSDGDSVADACDQCPGYDDKRDRDGDTLPDRCDPCPDGPQSDDADGDGVADLCDACPGFDDALDADNDSVPDACDQCPGSDDTLDVDLDTVPDDCDVCPGRDDTVDADADTIPDGCDRCLLGDDAFDADADGVPDACDRCAGFDDAIDVDLDGFPDQVPQCDPCVGSLLTDTFGPTGTNKVDFLFVVEDFFNSVNQTNLAVAFPSLETQLVGIDWQIAVITTSDAQFQGPVITPGPGAPTAFTNQVTVSNQTTPARAGIDRAWEATQPGGDAAPGAGFLRNDALFVVVFVSNTFDFSVTPPAQALADWVAMKGDPSSVLVHAFIPGFVGSNPCRDLVNAAGGLEFDIQTVSWQQDLPLVGSSVARDAFFTLDAVPVPDTLVVRDDGAVVHTWVYEPGLNALRFPAANLPTPGSILAVDYVEDCEGVVGGCSDGIDNDGDGLVDWPAEPGCTSLDDPNETDPFFAPQCADGVDNDGDGLSDYPGDPECDAASHVLEACDLLVEDRFGYRLCKETGVSGVCPDLSASPSALPLTDEGTIEVPLGFTFDLYGAPFTSVWIGANGTLSFDGPWSPPANQCLGTTSHDDTIYAWWDDLNPSGGFVWARTSGFAPDRSFDVQWRVPHFSGGSVDVRASLHEGTDEIDLCYVDTTAAASVTDGASATAGIQGRAGAQLEASCFSSNLTEGSVYRFLHP